jgi:hypothetical protein
MNPGELARLCDLIESRPSLLDRILEFDLLGYLFPPKPLSELGSVDGDTFSYHYRQTRCHTDAPTPGKYSYGARLGKVVVGEAKPSYQRGTRESRLAQVVD